MRFTEHTLKASDGVTLHFYAWAPDRAAPRAVIHIAHGLAEHATRYARVAEALTRRGFVVYANDHRGHGKGAGPSDRDLGVFAEEDGWNRVVRDLAELIEHERGLHPDLPQVLMGHSLGSIMVQQFLYEHERNLAAVILSGTSGKPPAIAALGRVIARVERLRQGKRGLSKIIDRMVFGEFNRPFEPARTPFDWLSRDEAEVDAYITDPYCGHMCSNQFWVDFLDAAPVLSRPDRQARIRKDLPIYIFAGEMDPLGKGDSVRGLVQSYRRVGIAKIDLELYPGGRHEMLNETNRDQVTQNLISWLDEVLPDARPQEIEPAAAV